MIEGDVASAEGERGDQEAALIAASEWFDADWYLATYPDARQSELAPSVHYLRVGAAAGHDPGPRFGTQAYLEAHPDVAADGSNPLVHYLQFGIAEGRPLRLGVAAEAPAAAVAVEMSDVERIAASEWFDAEWYLARNPDVAAMGADPAAHYLEYGRAEARDPGPNFSNSDYLAANPDVARARVNPLLHYLTHGQAEGRPRVNDTLAKRAGGGISAGFQRPAEDVVPGYRREAMLTLALNGADVARGLATIYPSLMSAQSSDEMIRTLLMRLAVRPRAAPPEGALEREDPRAMSKQ